MKTLVHDIGDWAVRIGKPILIVAYRLLRPCVLASPIALIGACAAPPPPAPPAPVAPVWTSAIGHLTIGAQTLGCTAVLVKPDVIATVSHCLYPNGVQVPADLLTFTPSGKDPASTYRGLAILIAGGAIAPGRISENQAAEDWALVKIERDDSVWPVPLAPISNDEIRADLANGAQFYSAGYGSGAKTRLSEHKNCGPLPPDLAGVTEGEKFFSTSCIVRLGDSGGPVALLEDGQPRLVGLIVGFSQHPRSGEPIAIVVSARAFAPYISGPLISLNGGGGDRPLLLARR
jgi:V8-like Glu-specific endopeptidase